MILRNYFLRDYKKVRENGYIQKVKEGISYTKKLLFKISFRCNKFPVEHKRSSFIKIHDFKLSILEKYLLDFHPEESFFESKNNFFDNTVKENVLLCKQIYFSGSKKMS